MRYVHECLMRSDFEQHNNDQMLDTIHVFSHNMSVFHVILKALTEVSVEGLHETIH